MLQGTLPLGSQKKAYAMQSRRGGETLGETSLDSPILQESPHDRRRQDLSILLVHYIHVLVLVFCRDNIGLSLITLGAALGEYVLRVRPELAPIAAPGSGVRLGETRFNCI